jgi:hypothetical protein
LDLVISAATHRTGSTLLQRIFNARDKTLVWGENGKCLTDFCKIYKNTKRFARFRHRNNYFKNNEDPNQWIACMTPPQNEVKIAMIEAVRTFYDELYTKNYRDKYDFIGYKEVGHGNKELLLLRECYPDCTVILLVRNPVEVWESLSPAGRKELYGSLGHFTKVWNQRAKVYCEMSQSDANMHLMRYEDIIARQTETLNLIKKIGHIEDQVINKVLDKIINSSSSLLPLQTKEFILERCKGYMETLDYIHE